MWFWNELSSLAEVSLYSLSNPTVILTFSWYTLFSQTRKWRPSHSGITVSPGMEEIPSLNKPFQMLKITTLPPDLPRSGPLTHSGEILTTGKSHAKKSDRFSTHHQENKQLYLQHLVLVNRCRYVTAPIVVPTGTTNGWLNVTEQSYIRHVVIILNVCTLQSIVRDNTATVFVHHWRILLERSENYSQLHKQ